MFTRIQSMLFISIVALSTILIESAPVPNSETKSKKEAHPAQHQEMRWTNQLSPVDIDIPYKRDGGESDIGSLSPVDIEIPYKRNTLDDDQTLDDPILTLFVEIPQAAQQQQHQSPVKRSNVDSTIVDLNTLERIMAAGR